MLYGDGPIAAVPGIIFQESVIVDGANKCSTAGVFKRSAGVGLAQDIFFLSKEYIVITFFLNDMSAGFYAFLHLSRDY